MTLTRVAPSRIAAAALLAAAAALAAAAPARGDGEDDAKKATQAVDFVRQVKPLLERTCVKCHGPAKQKGDYRLDGEESASTPGESAREMGYRPIVPGKSAESLVIRMVKATAPDKEKKIQPMPPKKERVRLSAEEIALIARWIDEGAPWPDGVTLEVP